MLQAALSTYLKVAQVSLGVAIGIFSARVALSVALIAQPGQYGALVKELVVFFAGLSLFPMVFKSVVFTSASISQSLYYEEVARVEGEAGLLWSTLFSDNAIFATATSLLPIAIDHLARAIYSTLLGAICAIAPIVLLFQLMNGQFSGVISLGTAVMTLSSWPILWNALGLLGKNLWPSFAQTSMAGVCFWFAVKLLQLLSPLFAAMFFKGFSTTGIGRSAKVVTVIKKVVMKS